MLNCPFCGGNDFAVVDVRNQEKSKGIRRRRECKSCGKRFTTYEVCSDMYHEVEEKIFPEKESSKPGVNFLQMRRSAIKTATDLEYDKYIIKELENAKNETQLSQIMAKGRRRSYAD